MGINISTGQPSPLTLHPIGRHEVVVPRLPEEPVHFEKNTHGYKWEDLEIEPVMVFWYGGHGIIYRSVRWLPPQWWWRFNTTSPSFRPEVFSIAEGYISFSEVPNPADDDIHVLIHNLTHQMREAGIILREEAEEPEPNPPADIESLPFE